MMPTDDVLEGDSPMLPRSFALLPLKGFYLLS
jgi:hypothetical protein